MDFATAASAPDPKAPLAKQRQWLELQRLAFANDQAEMRFESEALADEIGLMANITRFEPRERGQAFAHKASLLLAGDMAVSAAVYVPLVASTEDYTESTLGLPYQGSTRFRIEGRDWFDRPGQQALYLPGQAYEVETDHYNGVLFNLNPQRLVQTIGRESKGRIPLELAERWVERPVQINLCDPRVIQQQRIIESGLDTLASNSDTGLGHPYSSLALGLETLVYQCSARMLLISLN
jgi:hypothetical protein